MFDNNTLNVGDNFYRVSEKISVNKPERRIIDGEVWERKVFTNSVQLEKFQVVGILHKNLDGKWKEDEYDLLTEYYIYSFEKDMYFDTFPDWFYHEDKGFFHDLEDARTSYNIKKELLTQEALSATK